MSNKAIQGFSTHLFWDVDPKSLDLDTHGVWLLERVVGYGEMSDWNLLKKLYPKTQMRKLAEKAKSIDPVSRVFLATYLELDQRTFRSYTTKPLQTRFLDM